MSKQHFKETLTKLVETFERNIDVYKNRQSDFNEAQLREQFLNPMFQALGWDMSNEKSAAEQYKEVVHEDKVYVEGKPKAPDYSFRIGGQRKFFVEAKQPFVKIKTDFDPALQLRRYAWSAHLPISILTDFEEFAVYDTTIEPKAGDSASTARIEYFTFDQYLDKWEQIYDLFANESILKGSFDKYVAREKKGGQAVDKVFLSELEKWREWLAKDIAKHNPKLSVDELNNAVQKLIDRIIFLRIAEDRGIERYKTLQHIISSTNSYPELVRYFKRAHEKYNSSLFDFEDDKLTPKLQVSDQILDKILSHLYYPNSPYEFSVIGVELLGSIYEQFLGKVIRLTDSHNAMVEDKPEVKKAGGVFYTPQYIVEYIVKNTVGELIKDKTPKQVEKLKVLDPACGSGSFLIGAYECLLSWHLEYYSALSDVEKAKLEKKAVIYRLESKDPTGDKVVSWQLTTEEKKKIMLNNIYGVDIDSQAVEVTKLSLALKMLENENQETITMQMKLFPDRVLPDLSSNIKCGNSLVGSDYWNGKDLGEVTDAEIKKVNAFDWDVEFKSIIGNSPLKVTIDQQNFKLVKRLQDEGKIIAFQANSIEQQNRNVEKQSKAAVWDNSVWDGGDVFPGEEFNKLKCVLNEQDAHHLYSAYINGSTYFVTDDKGDFISNDRRQELQNILKGKVQIITFDELKKITDDIQLGGFDAVIGNPPYVRQELFSEFKPYYEKKFETYAGTADLYTYFIESGTKLINEKGFYSIIVANKWMRAKYGEKLRKYLQNKNVEAIVDFGDLPVFETATTYPCIITIKGGRPNNTFNATNVNTLDFTSLGEYVGSNSIAVDQTRLDPAGWSLVDVKVQDLLDKLSKVGVPLGEYVEGKIYYGIKTGFNEAFVIDEETKDRLIAEDPKSAEVIKPFLAGREIKRYAPVKPINYLIFTRRGVDIDSYPAVKIHLEQYKKQLMPKPNDWKGEKWSGRKPGSYKWYEIQDAVDYYGEFEKEKIIYPNICSQPEFTFDKDGNYANQKCFIIARSDLYLLGVLNSKVTNFWFNSILPKLRGDFFEPSWIIFKHFPIPKGETINQFTELVKDQLQLKAQLSLNDLGKEQKKILKQRIGALDKQINEIVYGLYGLTQEEIDIIENSV